jgi:hypothetical protein
VKIQILQEAKEEWAGAIQYYKDITPGLGIRLKRQVKEVLSWIKVNSELPRLRTKGYRRVNCKTFPYYIAYSIRKNEIFIVAIANSYKYPDFWIERMR